MISSPNKVEFERVCKALKDGVPLNLRMIGLIFGQDFWELMLLCMTDCKVSYAELLSLFEKG